MEKLLMFLLFCMPVYLSASTVGNQHIEGVIFGDTDIVSGIVADDYMEAAFVVVRLYDADHVLLVCRSMAPGATMYFEQETEQAVHQVNISYHIPESNGYVIIEDFIII